MLLTDGQPLDWQLDPLDAIRRWPKERQLVCLHSGRLNKKWSRWSILAEPAGSYRFVAPPSPAITIKKNPPHPNGHSQWVGPPNMCPVERFTHKPFTDLRHLLNTGDGIWVGYLGYDLGRWIERLPYTTHDDRGWPIIELAHCPGYLVHDRVTNRWSAHGVWRDALPDLQDTHESHDDELNIATPRSGFTQEAYEHAVAVVKEYIAAGDVFQVNLAQRFTAKLDQTIPNSRQLSHTGRALFDRLANISPAWYGAYLELAQESSWPEPNHQSHRAILSTSPELFLQISGRDVVTRPIKGTRPAEAHPGELRDSAKDTAELNMIVDLMRNDLGRVCDYGSVRITQPRTIESHPTVHHGVATVQGRLHESMDIVDLLRATIPSGSVTGAPKIRAMQIIDKLEPVRRGPYCGCIGYLSRDSACLSVAIRTMLVDTATGTIDFSVGGGVVADSQPEAEYQETLDKASAMLAAMNGCEVAH